MSTNKKTIYTMRMNYDYEIINLFKEIKRIDSDNKVANLIGLSRSFISNVKKGNNILSEKIVVTMAKLAGIKIIDAWAKRCEKRIIDQL